jgi:hypothetical protein
MIAIVVVFALLAVYGEWEHLRRPETITATIKSAPVESASPLPNAR